MVGQFLNHALGPSDIHAPKYSKNLAKIKLIKKIFKWPFLQKIDKKVTCNTEKDGFQKMGLIPLNKYSPHFGFLIWPNFQYKN